VRNPREIAFRLKQELLNLCSWLSPPSLEVLEESPLAGLPDPATIIDYLRGSQFAGEVVRLAELILRHRFPLLGTVIETGEEVDWRRDYIHEVTSNLTYFRMVPYLDFSVAGEHKMVWELNRHQHLVLLAQAFRFTGRDEFVQEICHHLESWLAANPYMRGINWTSALEVALRALSWTWAYHLVGGQLDASLKQRLLEGIYLHGIYVERNLSIYFSPNTHLLGEAVALHALGVLFPSFPAAHRWRRLGAGLVASQMDFQVREDGSHFEQSSYYHLYALDMFLFHQALCMTTPDFTSKLGRMAEYLASLMGDARLLPMLGDEDGGRFFHPYGSRDRFGRATLATNAALLGNPRWIWREEDLHEQAIWWIGVAGMPRFSPDTIGVPYSQLFPQSGIGIMRAESLHIVIDAGPFGFGAAGHSHSDTLSLIVRLGSEDVLIDPGTYTYVADPQLRNCFRSSAAHNTVRIGERDQAVSVGPFRWTGKPEVWVREWKSTLAHDFLDAECCYFGFRHRRRFLLLKPNLLFVFDEIEGPDGSYPLEQFWHFGEPAVCVASGAIRIGAKSCLVLPEGERAELSEGGEHGWRSPVFGTKRPANVLRRRRNAPLPVSFWAVLDSSGGSQACLQVEDSRTCKFRMEGRETVLRYGSEGLPAIASATFDPD
jgi:hypothetical protein